MIAQKKRMILLLIFGLAIWLKTYIVYKASFDLPMENLLQEIILILNPISSILLLIAVSTMFKGKLQKYGLLIIDLVATVILYANVVYYRFFSDFITIPVLFQTNNMGDLGGSIFELIQWQDIFLFIDIPILAYLVSTKFTNKLIVRKKETMLIFASALVMFAINIGLAEMERPQLLTRTFDREMLVKNIGTFNYHIYDSVMQTKTRAKRALADSSEITEVENYIRANNVPVNPNFTAKAKGKNVFVISLESTQNFVINNKVAGKEITPFLNDLIDQKGTYYFNNFYHQTGQGKTSDSEFIVDNSMYGLPSGAAFFTHAQNEYNATPEIIKEKGGYSSYVFHANNKSFWNRDIMYQTLGYDKYYSLKYFTTNKENSIGWGLKDDQFYAQSMKYLTTLPEPFYAKFITLTNHFPFTLNKEDEMIPEWTSDDGTVNRYFTTVRYEDEALKKFFNMLKEKGMYKDSMFVIYGDHYGISENHNEAMGEYLGKEVTPMVSAQLQKVPFIVHIPGDEGNKMIDTVSGQVDVQPTLLNLLGIKSNNLQFGNDMFSKQKKDFAVFRDGSVITDQYIYTEDKCYQSKDGTEAPKEKCAPYVEKGKNDLMYSDKIIYGDLLRFYNN